MAVDIKLYDHISYDELLNSVGDIRKVHQYDWDIMIDNIPYYVCRLDDFPNSIGYYSYGGINTYWAYPRSKVPNGNNLIPFNGHICNWGIRFEEINYCSHSEVCRGSKTIITRNGKDFCKVDAMGINYGIDKARCLITRCQEHPLELSEIDYDAKMIGRRVWYRSQPAYISSYVYGQACVILKPEEEPFKIPAELSDDFTTDDYYESGEAKVSIFSEHIDWFRRVAGEDHIRKTRIISVFPATGKSEIFRNSSYSGLTILDSDSSNFSWIKDENGNNTEERNPEFPANYIVHIKENIGKADYIFVSSHEQVREALKNEGIDYTVIIPDNTEECKTSWIRRCRERGSSDSFIKVIENNWDKWIIDIMSNERSAIRLINPKSYLIDALCEQDYLNYLNKYELMKIRRKIHYENLLKEANCTSC